MSTQTNQLPEHIEDELAKSNSSRLREKVTEVYDAMQTSDVDQEIDITVQYDDGDLTTIKIDPNERWWVEGERGFSHFHLILGPRGGLKTARQYNVLTDDRHHAGKRRAWDKVLRAIGRSD